MEQERHLHAVPNVPRAPEPEPTRLERLEGYFLDMASGNYPPQTTAYIQSGGSLRLCLDEVLTLREPCEDDFAMLTARESYVDVLLHKPHLQRKGAHQFQAEQLKLGYMNTVLTKIDNLIEAQTPRDALRLGQMPTIIRDATFSDRATLSHEDFAANHLYLLVDTLLKEHVSRREYIDQTVHGRRLHRILGNRALRLGVAGGVFFFSLSPKVPVFPTPDEVAEHVELGLQVLAGGILLVETPEVVRSGVLDIVHAKDTRKLRDEMAEDKTKSDLALRIAYNATRYGNDRHQADLVRERYGTSDKVENLRRFDELDEQFAHLNNDPGGKPYSGEQALGYAARLLIERKDQIEAILAPGRAAVERHADFIKLAQDMLDEDLARMEKGLSRTAVRRAVTTASGVTLSVVMPGTFSKASEAFTLSRDTAGAMHEKKRED